MNEKYSVLMSVYYKEKPEYLRESMDSIYDQTIMTDDFVLVCDGPLNMQLDSVITEMQKKFGERLNVLRLEKNGGLGNALNIGLKECKNELVARMDSDDISRPDRCARQLKIFEEQPRLSIVSGTVEEFDVSVQQVSAKRVLPEWNDDIIEFAKRRNPFNHPCVMYKKSHVEAVGSYQDFREGFHLIQDYHLWMRMLLSGMHGYNIQTPLLWMRAGEDMYQRRSGIEYGRAVKQIFKFMYENKFIKAQEYYSAVAERTIISIMPNEMRIFFYKHLLRN